MFSSSLILKQFEIGDVTRIAEWLGLCGAVYPYRVFKPSQDKGRKYAEVPLFITAQLFLFHKMRREKKFKLLFLPRTQPEFSLEFAISFLLPISKCLNEENFNNFICIPGQYKCTFYKTEVTFSGVLFSCLLHFVMPGFKEESHKYIICYQDESENIHLLCQLEAIKSKEASQL